MITSSIINNYDNVFKNIDNQVKSYGYGETKMNISTIMPYTVQDRSLYNIFEDNPVNLYYSMYSVNGDFKRKWMPNAIHYRKALDKLKEFQDLSPLNPTITIHGAFIKGEMIILKILIVW